MSACKGKGSCHKPCKNCLHWLEEAPFAALLTESKSKEPLPPGIAMMLDPAKVGHAGKVTANGRLYTRARMEPRIQRLNDQLRARPGSVIGEANHPRTDPTSGTADPPDINHSALKFYEGFRLEEDGSIYSGRIGVVPTEPYGKNIVVCVRAGLEVGFSSRARGTATKVTMNDQHPDFELNREWEGKEVEEINDDLVLTTYDAVIGPSVGDAVVSTFHENENQEEEAVKIDLSKLSAEELKDVLEQKAVKDVVEAAVRTAVEEATKKLEEQFEKDVLKEIDAYLKSPEFAEHFVPAPGTELDEAGKAAPKAEEQACPECGAKMPSGKKFCSECGVRMTPSKKEQTQDDKDKALAEMRASLETLRKQNEDLAGQVKKHQAEDDDRQEQDRISDIIVEAVEGKPQALVEQLDKALEGVSLDSKTAKEIVGKKVAMLESLMKASGGAPGAARGASVPGDALREQQERDSAAKGNQPPGTDRLERM